MAASEYKLYRTGAEVQFRGEHGWQVVATRLGDQGYVYDVKSPLKVVGNGTSFRRTVKAVPHGLLRRGDLAGDKAGSYWLMMARVKGTAI